MNSTQQHQITSVLTDLFHDSRNDHIKMMKGVAKSIFRPLQPSDFEEAYLSISKEQGAHLVTLITENECRRIVEFGTSFGISTLYLAQGALETGGHNITTELLESKALKASENFRKAGVDHLIELRTGDAMETLAHHPEPIDLLLLDGWKDLYWPLFEMLEPYFHANTLTYVDNADMSETQLFLELVAQRKQYELQALHKGKVVLIRKKIA